MTVREIVTGGERFQVTGGGYAPHGEFLKCREAASNPKRERGRALHETRNPETADSERVGALVLADASGYMGEPINARDEPDLLQALTTAVRCNNATVSPRGDEADSWQVIGDPTEGALVVAALKAGIEARDREQQVLFEIPFDSERKTMSVVRRGSAGARIIPHAVMGEMFNRYAIGVRAHADGVGVKQANVSSWTVRGLCIPKARRR